VRGWLPCRAPHHHGHHRIIAGAHSFVARPLRSRPSQSGPLTRPPCAGGHRAPSPTAVPATARGRARYTAGRARRTAGSQGTGETARGRTWRLFAAGTLTLLGPRIGSSLSLSLHEILKHPPVPAARGGLRCAIALAASPACRNRQGFISSASLGFEATRHMGGHGPWRNGDANASANLSVTRLRGCFLSVVTLLFRACK
jgi:hypothetical protein